MCHQGRIDHHLMVLVVLKEGDNYHHVQRFLSLLGNTQNIYFWIAKAGSKSGRQVLQKFGSKGQETGIFILAPTSSRPNLVERYSGQTLENVSRNEVKDAIERGQTSLQGLTNEWERDQLRKAQELELEQCLKIDKKKGQAKPTKYTYDSNDDHDAKAHRIREERNNRVAPEAEEGTTIILRYGSLKIKRRFKPTALFQEVYDWAGSVEALPLHFTIQRRREVVLHEHPVTEGEVLDVYEREEENVKELLDSQVSFRGNVPQAKEDRLSATVVDEVQKEKPRKEKRVKERKIEKRASRESTSKKRKDSIRKKLKKLKKGKLRKREVAQKSITLAEDTKQGKKETKETVEEGKEIGSDKETQVQEEKEEKGEESKQENKEAKEKGEDEKDKETQVQVEKEEKGEESKQNKEAKETVEDEKEIETQVQEEKEDKGEDTEDHDTKNRRKRKKDKRTGSQRKKSKKE